MEKKRKKDIRGETGKRESEKRKTAKREEGEGERERGGQVPAYPIPPVWRQHHVFLSPASP